MIVRKAVMTDVEEMYALIEMQAKQGVVLPRSRASLYENLQSMFVAEWERQVVGVVGLHILDKDLAEVRSLVVSPGHGGKGIGKQLVAYVVKEAAALQIKRVFSLTYQIDFFKKCGFSIVRKETLPQKIWKDCIHCPKLFCCDETAMIVDSY